MTQDAKTTEETQATETQEQSPETKTENMVPGYRLKEEADKRRTIQAELDDLKAKEQARADEDLSYKERYTKEVEGRKSDAEARVLQDLQHEFTQATIEAGLPSKIAKVAVPSDLSSDNMKDKVKHAIKEFSDFVKEDPKTKPLGAVQPTAAGTVPKMDEMNSQDLLKQSIKRTNETR